MIPIIDRVRGVLYRELPTGVVEILLQKVNEKVAIIIRDSPMKGNFSQFTSGIPAALATAARDQRSNPYWMPTDQRLPRGGVTMSSDTPGRRGRGSLPPELAGRSQYQCSCVVLGRLSNVTDSTVIAPFSL
jgi:hypothetical protein